MRNNPMGVLIASIGFVMLTAGVLIPLPWIARESLFEFTARTPKNRDVGETISPTHRNQSWYLA